MRVIRQPLPEPASTREVRVSCDCGAILAVTRADAIERVHDRDGLAYVFRCPCCRGQLWVAEEKFA